MTKIYIIAGETSGDFLGHLLIQNLKKEYTKPIEFIGIGGPLMEIEGLVSLFPISEISLMGFLEILPHIFKLKQLLIQTVEDIKTQNPVLLITIDSPGFTYRVANKISHDIPNLKIVHIVAPSVWAYKPSRALKYAKIYDYLLTLLPFEPPYFEKKGLKSTFIGHPVLEQNFYYNKYELRKEIKVKPSSKIICVTPGSRKGEIMRHMPIFRQALDITAQGFSDLEVIFVTSNKEHRNLIKEFLKEAKFIFRFSEDKLKLYALAHAAIAKSGTNTLEIAASNTPMVVAYRVNPVTFWLIKRMIKIKYASLINIISNEEILPEFIQSNCTPHKIAAALLELLFDKEKELKQVEASQKILKKLGFKSNIKPSKKAAKVIIDNFLKS